jgi:hypothetical protein
VCPGVPRRRTDEAPLEADEFQKMGERLEKSARVGEEKKGGCGLFPRRLPGVVAQKKRLSQWVVPGNSPRQREGPGRDVIGVCVLTVVLTCGYDLQQ